MPLTLDQALARVPLFANARELKTTPLTGGITNKNFRVDADGASYVLRITGADTELLGIRRDVEYAANRAAGELGVAPEVVYFIEPEGYLVTRFVDGAPIAPAEMRQPHNIARVAEKLRTFHTPAPTLASEFNVFRRIEMLTRTSRAHNCRFPKNFEWIVERVRETEIALMRDPYTPRPCHDDLLNLNFLDAHGEIRILDWEYAGMGDIFFDLANFASHHRFDDDQVRELLRAYFGDVTAQHFARLKLMWAMSEIHEAMWGTTQTGISKLDEDFQGYADLWFARATQAMQDARWDEWLSKAAVRVDR
jgi:thiamine kinase-like enzyme